MFAMKKTKPYRILWLLKTGLLPQPNPRQRIRLRTGGTETFLSFHSENIYHVRHAPILLIQDQNGPLNFLYTSAMDFSSGNGTP